MSNGDLHSMVQASSSSAGPFLVVNVGTGFGAALLLKTPAGWHSIPIEAGHLTLAVIDKDCSLTFNAVNPVSVEDKVSGLALPPGQPFASTEFASEFGESLGSICGNLVLATGAWGGVYLCGTVASAWVRTGNPLSFIAAFRNKGRMSDRMARAPISEILVPHPALIGLSAVELP